MIGLDTNVLVRYVTQDDPVQSPKATEIIEQKLTTANPGFVSIVTMAEVVWVLDRSYGLTAPEIVATIEQMLQADVLIIENEQEVFAATMALKQGVGTFPDALVGELSAKAGCAHTLTFDRKALRLPGFKLLT
ncbi:MAG TPA: type II toxin-antitoxin system VapC family toxin [Candidatus Angelobacter sp.]